MTNSPVTLTAQRLVGLLAEPDRLRVIASLTLGATTTQAIVEASGLDQRTVVDATDRLVGSGLVEAADGEFFLLEAAFKVAARSGAVPAPATQFPDQPAEVQAVLDRVVRNGRLERLPVKWSQKKIVLDWVAQRFEPGLRYSEKQVNASLAEIHHDTATLRRYLVDAQMMDRAAGEYWRSGGSITA